MTWFGLGPSSGLNEIISNQVKQWDFGNFLVPFGVIKIIVVDSDGLFAGMSKKTFQETLLVLIHAVSSGNHKTVINEGFHWYFNKFQKINSADKCRLNQ